MENHPETLSPLNASFKGFFALGVTELSRYGNSFSALFGTYFQTGQKLVLFPPSFPWEREPVFSFSGCFPVSTSPVFDRYSLLYNVSPPAALRQGALPSGVVDGVVGAALPLKNELADGYNIVSLLEQVLQDPRQSLRRVQGGVMEEDNGSRPHLFRHPLGDGGRVIVLPVQAVHVPLDGLNAHGPDGGDHVVVILPEGGPKEGGAHACDGLDLVVAGVDVRDNLVGGEGVEVGVVVGVAHHLMAGLGQRLDRFGVFLRPLPHHKKGDLHIVSVKDVDEGLGVLIPPG